LYQQQIHKMKTFLNDLVFYNIINNNDNFVVSWQLAEYEKYETFSV